MSRAAKRAGLDGSKKITNHSARRTACSQLYQANVPPVMIAQILGHKNINSLQHYTEASEEQQLHMSNLLVNSGRSGKQLQTSASNPMNQSSTNVNPGVHRAALPQPMSTNGSAISENGASVPNVSGEISENSTNILNQARGLMGFMTNATFNGTVNINLNINQ